MFFYVIGQCNCNSGIPVDILVYFNKINSKQVERINCKNVFLLLLHKCLKACIYANSLVLRLCDFSFSWKSKCFPEKPEWNAQVLPRKQLCKSFVFIRCFIKTDKMKCLRSISDTEYLFCFGVTDQIKHSFNQSLISLHIGQWNLARCRHGHFEWLAFDTDQRFTKVKDTMIKIIEKFNGQ